MIKIEAEDLTLRQLLELSRTNDGRNMLRSELSEIEKAIARIRKVLDETPKAKRRAAKNRIK